MFILPDTQNFHKLIGLAATSSVTVIMDNLIGFKDYISFGVICASGIGAVFYTVSLGFDCVRKARQYQLDKKADAARRIEEQCEHRRRSGECPLSGHHHCRQSIEISPINSLEDEHNA